MMKWASKSPFIFLLPEYDNILFCMLHTVFIIFIILISHDSREPFPMRPTACRVSSPMFFLVLYFFTPTQSTITVLFLDCTGKMNTAWNSSHSSLRSDWSAKRLAETPLLLRKPCYRQCSRDTIKTYHQLTANFIKIFVIFFSKDDKNASYLVFPLIWCPLAT